jgi:hypothetical protein
MYWIIRFLIFISILLSTSNARILSDYGIKIGIVSSKYEMDLKNFSEEILIINRYEKSRLGPNIGIYIRYLNWSHFDFETELSYVQKGATLKKDYYTSLSNLSNELRFDYIQFKNSLVPKIQISSYGIYGIIGFSLDYLLSVKSGNISKSRYSKYVTGYILGIGFETGILNTNRIFLELALNKDINEIHEWRWARYYNSLISLNLGLSFKNIL